MKIDLSVVLPTNSEAIEKMSVHDYLINIFSNNIIDVKFSSQQGEF